MDLLGALRARLLGAPAVADALWLSPGTNQRAVYPVQRPQSTALPAITLQTISGDRPQTYDGFQGWRAPRIQMDVWALTYAESRAIMEAAVAALAPRVTSNGIKFDRMGFEGEADEIEQIETTTIYRTRIDLLVRHEPV